METQRRRSMTPAARLALTVALSVAASACNTANGPALPGNGDFAVPGGGGDGAGGGSPDMTQRPGDGGGGAADMACAAAPSGACSACLQANCNAEMTACFSGTWSSTGSMNGVCAGLFACECECAAKGGKGCRTTCAQMLGQTCFDCIVKVATCIAKSCVAQCPL